MVGAQASPPAAAGAPEHFVGRQREFAVLTECAGKAAAGSPCLARIEGPTGIGKTTLMRRFVNSLEDFTILHATADPSESGIAFGVVHQLHRRHDRALVGRFPLLADRRVDDIAPFAVGADLLGLLGEMQRSHPVAVVIDDVQWADAPSLQALGFVLRRLWADSVLVLLVGRTGRDTDDIAGLRLPDGGGALVRINLGGLSEPEVGSLAQRLAATPLPAEARKRLYAQTGGHPLYTRAVALELAPDVLRQTARNWPVPPSLQAAVQATLVRLPEHAQRLIEALAVLDRPCPLTAAARLAEIAEPAEALGHALAAELVEWWPAEPSSPVGIRHRLQRNAVYEALTPERRRRLHRSAARMVDRASAWAHRVAAAASSDPGLAAELEQAADDEASAGHAEQAATYQLWAAQLSDTRAGYERRLLTACLQSVASWRATWAMGMLGEVQACADSALRSCVLGVIALLGQGDLALAEHWLSKAEDDAATRPDLEWISARAAAFRSGLYLWQGKGNETVQAARAALASPSLDPGSRGVARLTLAVGRAREAGLRTALDEMTGAPAASLAADPTSLEALSCRGALRTMVGELCAAREDLTAVLDRLSKGAPTQLMQASHTYLATALYLLGHWDEARITAERGLSIVESGGQVYHYALAHLAATMVPAGRGDWAAAAQHVRAAQRSAECVGTRQDFRYAAVAAALLGQARGDHAAMLNALDPLRREDTGDAGHDHVWWQSWWRPLLVEALLGVGKLDEADAALDRVEDELGDIAYLAVVRARLRGRLTELRGDGQAALQLYRLGLAEPGGPDDAPLHRAMLEHSCGRLLRRMRRRRQALQLLRRAHDRYAALDARPFMEACTDDLAACGLRGTPQDNALPLTARERDVAYLVARGFSNDGAARELYVSVKTIEYHLGHVYAKLGIASRHELAAALGPSA